jgi:hypothetical protein
MMRPIARLAAVVLLGAASVHGASAHHSFAIYDQGRQMTLKGTVKSMQWANPHVVIWVVATSPEGAPAVTWSVETTSPGVLTRAGWSRNSLKPGDRVSVDIKPLRDGSHGGGLEAITLEATGQVLKANFTTREKPDIQ